MTSKIIVNTIEADTGISSVTFASNINLQNDSSVLVSSSGIRLGTGSTIAAPSANEITLSTNSAERVRINSAGKVGIGTAVPTELFTVYSPINGVTASIEANTTRAYDSATLKFLGGNLSTNTLQFGDATVADVGKIVYNHDGNSLAFTVNAAERLRITSTGLVGIGTNNPDATLKVNVASGNNGVVVQNTSTANIALFGARNGDATVQIGQWGSSASGSTFGLSNADLSFIYTTSYSTTHPSALALGTVSNKPIVFATNNTERLRITPGGSVGIGENSPDRLLHIKGASSTAYSGGSDTADYNFLKIENTTNDRSAGVFFLIGSNGEAAITATEVSDGATDIAFQNRGGGVRSEKVRITSDGKLNIGSSSAPGTVGGFSHINVHGTGINANGAISLYRNSASPSAGQGIGAIYFANSDGNPGAYIQGQSDGTWGTNDYPGRLVFFTTSDGASSATERLRIDSSGRLLVGTTNSTGTQLIKVNGDTSGSTYGGHIALTQGRTSPGNGATHGVLSFGTETRPEVVKVVSFVDGTWTDGQYHPSGLYISTTDYNRNSPTEKIRITDIGEINCYSSGACIQAGTLQGGGYNVYFYEGRRNQNTGGTRTYIVWSNGNVENTNNSYGSISDQRLKENIVDATSQWDDIKSLQIRKYNFREATGNETHTQIGLIAQEVESVSPGLVQTTAVSEGDVLQDADGNQMESVKSINYSVLYMKSVKALQEAQTRIETLETQLTDALARITALEGS